ncbi:MAG TPA: PKD domain-containing protein, partial [Pseudonocardiaceae bacterium]|nr:PKD domain-containing protein [Pseudonocardiaceae bacterium]
MRRSIIPLVIAVAMVAGSAVTATAATTPTDLFVGGPACSDTGSGSQDTPFCTMQAAAAAVLPGQTVHVAHGRYTGDVHFVHSGEPGSPITFVGAGDPRDGDTNSVLDAGADGGGFTFIGVHDIDVTGFQLADSTKVLIDHSDRIGVEHNVLTGGNAIGILVLGLSGGVTISRNFVSGFTGDGVFVEPGATATTITTNLVNANRGRGIDVDDDPGTIITGNTVAVNCEGGIALEDTAGGATVENNLVEDNDSPAGSAACAGEAQLGELSVSAASTSGTTADYNLVFTDEADPLYNWAGDTFTDPAAFATATGQGTHDIDQDPGPFLTSGSLPTLSPPVDSANSDAPGETAVDINGAPRVDNPLVPDTGVGIDDRGALEAQDPLQVEGVTMSPTKAPVGQSVTASVDVVNPWSTPLSFSFDFGDGSAPVVTSTPSAVHTYDAVGVHTVSVTATTPAGVVKTANPTTVQIAAPAPLVADVRAFQTGPLSIAVDTGASTDSWQITDYAIDFGDGTPQVHTTDTTVLHTYAAPGTYTVSATETDFAINHAGAVQQVTVASGYFPTAPSRVLDTRDGTGVRLGKLGANGVVSLKLAGTHGIPATGVRAVVLNVTAVSPTAASFLTVYPDGTTRPV